MLRRPARPSPSRPRSARGPPRLSAAWPALALGSWRRRHLPSLDRIIGGSPPIAVRGASRRGAAGVACRHGALFPTGSPSPCPRSPRSPPWCGRPTTAPCRAWSLAASSDAASPRSGPCPGGRGSRLGTAFPGRAGHPAAGSRVQRPRSRRSGRGARLPLAAGWRPGRRPHPSRTGPPWPPSPCPGDPCPVPRSCSHPRDTVPLRPAMGDEPLRSTIRPRRPGTPGGLRAGLQRRPRLRAAPLRLPSSRCRAADTRHTAGSAMAAPHPATSSPRPSSASEEPAVVRRDGDRGRPRRPGCRRDLSAGKVAVGQARSTAASRVAPRGTSATAG